MDLSQEKAEIRGVIDTVYRAASPKFSAGKIRASDGSLVRFAGRFMAREGDAVVLSGVWKEDPNYGRQIWVESNGFSYDEKLDVSGLARFLASHPDTKKIGPAAARRIAEAFGEDFDRAIMHDIDSVIARGRIDAETARNLQFVWIQRRHKNIAFTKLAKYELTYAQMEKLLERYENVETLISMLDKNPYSIMGEVSGFGFKRVDKIAQAMGVAADDPRRIRAAIIHGVKEPERWSGDTWIYREQAVDEAKALLGSDVGESSVIVELASLIKEGKQVVGDTVDGISVVADYWLHKQEHDLARMLCERANLVENDAFSGVDVEDLVAQVEPGLNEAQKRAVVSAATRNITLITGGAGVGKTFTIAAIAKLYRNRKYHGQLQKGRVALLAPTGKAAKRVEQVVGRPAATVHRFLGKKGMVDDFDDAEVTLIDDFDLVIVDEFSMVDVQLAWRLFSSLPKETPIVIVGDHNQLPPVGPGNPLRDIVRREILPTVVLDETLRQSGPIKWNSVALLSGEFRRETDARESSSWVVCEFDSAEGVEEHVHALFGVLLKKDFGFDVLRDVQLLTPQKGGSLGTHSLNRMLQVIVQSALYSVDVTPVPEDDKPEFYVGDRVIHTKNNYDLGVMNGACGVVSAIESKVKLRVKYDEGDESREVVYDNKDAIGQLQLAYALTVHKAQGSEYPCAIFIAHSSHSWTHRNLFYTAATRAKKTAIIVGDREGMVEGARRERLERRKTFLSTMNLPTFEDAE